MSDKVRFVSLNCQANCHSKCFLDKTCGCDCHQMPPRNAFNERRYGRVVISEKYAHDPEAMKSLLAHFVPLRIEHRFEAQEYTYVGYSDLFATVPPEQIVQEYRPKFHVAFQGAQPILIGFE